MYPDKPKPRRPVDPNELDLFAKPTRAPSVTSPSSQQAAREIAADTLKQRRGKVLAVIQGAGSEGLARFEIARIIGCPVHWVTSSVDNLIHVQKMVIETHRTKENPESGKQCAVLVAVEFATGNSTEGRP